MASLVDQRCPDFQAEDLDKQVWNREALAGRWAWLLFHRHLA